MTPRARTPSATLAASIGILASLAAHSPIGRAQSCPTRWDSTPGIIGTDTAVNATLPLPSGDIVVGGLFNTAGGVMTHHIARYRPSTNAWFTYGSGFSSGGVLALTTTASGDLVAGGFSFNGNTSGFISRWNAATSTWATTPNIGATVHALLTMPDGSIIVGSTTSAAAPAPISPIGKYNPATGVWSAWNFDFGVHVYALVRAANGDVYAAGTHLQRLDAATNTWSPITPPDSGILTTLSILPGGDLITAVSSAPNNGIWRMNIGTGVWSRMGPAMTAQGGSYAISPAGDLYACGFFVVNSMLTSFIKWDPIAEVWSIVPGAPPPSGIVTEDADAVVLPNGDFLLSGRFIYTMGGPTTHNLVLWTTRPTCAADFNCSGALDNQDVFDFINAWFNADPRTDFNRAGGPEVSDIFDFLNAWFAGC